MVTGLALAGYALAGAALVVAAGEAPRTVTPLVVVDGLALLGAALALLSGAATALFTHGDRRGGEREERQILLALAVAGAVLVAASRHFAPLVLGLALLSVALFPLIAYERRSPAALEAGIKYLVISGMATALLLFGAALLYAGSGTLDMAGIGAAAALPGPAGAWALGGIGLVVAALAVKMSLAPLHWWTPDVYQGTSAAVAGFLATAAKAVVAIALLRLAAAGFAVRPAETATVLAVLAVLSMLAGNLLALLQDNVLRVLAYSSIAHMGYLLVAFLTADGLGLEAAAFYLTAYVVTSLGAFGALTAAGPGAAEPAGLRGLHRRRPGLAAVLTLMLLSLAGIPLTASFVGKFYLFATGLDAALWVPLATLLLGSLIGLFYYLRLVAGLFAPEPARAAPPAPAPAWAGLAVLTLVVLWMGLWPTPWIEAVQGLTATGALPGTWGLAAGP